MTVAANAAGQHLQPWHKKLGLWLADQVSKPSLNAIIAEARKISRTAVRPNVVKTLLENPAFVAFRLQVTEEETVKARAIMEHQLPKAVEHHFTALEKLMEAERWDVVYRYTIPVIDRVWPEDRLDKLPAQIINVNIGGDFVARHGSTLDHAIDVTSVAEVTVA